MAHKRKVRLQERRSLVEGLARRILQRVVSGDLDAHEGCAQVRQIYLDESALLGDLKTLAEMGTDAMKEQMMAAAQDWLTLHPAARRDGRFA